MSTSLSLSFRSFSRSFKAFMISSSSSECFFLRRDSWRFSFCCTIFFFGASISARETTTVVSTH